MSERKKEREREKERGQKFIRSRCNFDCFQKNTESRIYTRIPRKLTLEKFNEYPSLLYL